MVGHLLRHSNWFTAQIGGTIEERNGRGRPSRREYTDQVKGGRSRMMIKRLFWEVRNCNPTNLWVEKKKKTSVLIDRVSSNTRSRYICGFHGFF